jgi:hypothetical protein
VSPPTNVGERKTRPLHDTKRRIKKRQECIEAIETPDEESRPHSIKPGRACVYGPRAGRSSTIRVDWLCCNGLAQWPALSDVRYGIHLKQTDEYGVYSFFVHDDGKISSRYARSDATFENETGLYR